MMPSLVTFLFAGCVRDVVGVKVETPTLERAPAQAYSSMKIDPMTPSTTDLTFEELKNVLEANRFSKISDLLAYLERTKPDYRSRYTLGHHSRSLHESSKSNPRAIVYGESADFIISFNGHKDQKAYEMLETVEFDRRENTFKFREIEFDENGKLGKPFQISEVGGPRTENGPKCLACHTGQRPIFESYHFWPGFFGSGDDFPFSPGSQNELPEAMGPRPQTAREDLAKFEQSRSQNDRYRHLRPLQAPRISKPKTDEPKPNTELTILLQVRNLRRVAQMIATARPSAPLKQVLLYALTCQALAVQETRPRANQRWFASARIRAATEKFTRTRDSAVADNSGFQLFEFMNDEGFSHDQFRHNLFAGYLRRLDAIDTELRSSSDSSPEEKAQLRNLRPAVHELAQRARRLQPLQVYQDAIGRPEGGLKEFAINKATQPDLAPFLAVAAETLPQSRVHLWPMNIYEGVHTYNTGLRIEVTQMETSLLALAFTAEEATRIRRLQSADRRSYCEELWNGLPADWR